MAHEVNASQRERQLWFLDFANIKQKDILGSWWCTWSCMHVRCAHANTRAHAEFRKLYISRVSIIDYGSRMHTCTRENRYSDRLGKITRRLESVAASSNSQVPMCPFTYMCMYFMVPNGCEYSLCIIARATLHVRHCTCVIARAS